MIELEFLGRSGDTRSIVFTDADGERYSVVVTDNLRSALRRSPAVAEVPDSARPPKAKLRPAQIQALLREGMSAEDISLQQGIPVESITRYESPILAEKAWAISRAQQAPITAEAGAPTLEDLVINRLAARGVDHRSLTWDARRRPGEDWEVSLTFVQSAVERSATWTLAETTNHVSAVDQEAHWLTETASPIAPVSAFLGSAVGPTDEADHRQIENLIEQANALRGRRQPVLEDLEGDLTQPIEAPVKPTYFSGRILPFDKDRSATARKSSSEKSAPPEKTGQQDEPDEHPTAKKSDDTALFDVEASPQGADTDARPVKRRSSKRRSVPSWDEIVFGAKTES